jgi:hypothetical protein
LNILVITDSQVKDGVSLDYLTWIGRHIIDTKPDVIVHIGDFADMPSLSSYDKGKKSYEGRRYKADIAAARRGMDLLLAPMRGYNAMRARNKKSQYSPRMILTIGNHEERILRAIENDPILDGTIGIEDLQYAEAGWEVYPFLEVVTVNGVAFSHYFQSGAKGMPAGSAQMLINKKHMSCVAGHQQGRQIAYANRADGKRITAIIAGSGYSHEESYLGKQGNKHWHGIVLLERVNDGEFDERFIPMQELQEKYA